MVSVPSVWAQGVVELGAQVTYEVQAQRAWLEDRSRSLTITEVLEADQAGLFVPAVQASMPSGYAEAAYWVRLRLAEPDALARPWLLEVANKSIDSLALYIPTGVGAFRVVETGDAYPFATRDLEARNFVFTLPSLSPTPTTFFIRVASQGPLELPLYLHSPETFARQSRENLFFLGGFFGILAVMALYNLLLYLSIRDVSYLFYVLYIVTFIIYQLSVERIALVYLWPDQGWWAERANSTLGLLSALLGIQFARSFMHTRACIPRWDRWMRVLMVGCVVGMGAALLNPGRIVNQVVAYYFLVIVVMLMAAAVTCLRQGHKVAQYYLVAWTFLLGGVVMGILGAIGLFPRNLGSQALQVGSVLEATLLSLGLGFRYRLLRNAREEAEAARLRAQVLQAENDRKELELLKARELAHAHQALAASHEALQASLDRLTRTQDHLIHAEKMASLGQLAAGIAHEIKNPLNFVNNFAALSLDLADDLEETLAMHREQVVHEVLPDLEEVLADLRANARKIAEHGKRADRIVSHMGEHATTIPGTQQRTPLNSLVAEYAGLARRGMQPESAAGSSVIDLDCDGQVGTVDVIPQEIGRVLLNLLQNAWDAVQKRAAQANGSYEPRVVVRTRRLATHVEIRVEDNGCGIPNGLLAKIFDPFFTTKPPGEGTGLGLWLSYEIVTQGHGGTLHAESTEGEGTTFIMTLPE